MSTIYKYKANNEESYGILAAFAVTLPVTVTLFPRIQTISIPEDAASKAGEFIDLKALDFNVTVAQTGVDDVECLLHDPASDASILREIALAYQTESKSAAEVYAMSLDKATAEKEEIQKNLVEAVKDRDTYNRFWMDSEKKNDRVRERVKAISVLIGAIYEDD